jgi:hypothetical protein
MRAARTWKQLVQQRGREVRRTAVQRHILHVSREQTRWPVKPRLARGDKAAGRTCASATQTDSGTFSSLRLMA